MPSLLTYHRRSNSGQCGTCGSPSKKGERCGACRAYKRAWRDKQRIKGNCIQCAKKAMSGRVHCTFCNIRILAKEATGSRKNAQFLLELLQYQDNLCNYCDTHIELGVNASLDHIWPIAYYPDLKGDITNLQWLCKRCNQAKSDMTEQELLSFAYIIINTIKKPQSI